MSDERLRSLERSWRETATEEAERAWELERLRRGLPPRVTVMDLRVQTYEPGLDDPQVAAENTGARDLEAAVRGVIERGHGDPWLVCDLTDLHYLQSRNVATLISAEVELRGAGGGLVLCGLQTNVRIVFELLGLLHVFGVQVSVAECLAERGWEQRGPRLEAVLLAVT